MLNAEMFVRQGLRSIVQTRDCRMPVGDFVHPMSELNKFIDPIVDWTFNMTVGVNEPLMKKLHAMRLPSERLLEEDGLQFANTSPPPRTASSASRSMSRACTTDAS